MCLTQDITLISPDKKTASTVPETVDYFNILQQLHVSFSGSSRSWTIFNTRAKLYVSFNSLSVTERSAHNTAVANLAMWVYRRNKGSEIYRNLKDSKIYFQRLGRVTENRRKKVIQKDNKVRIHNFNCNLEGHCGTFQYNKREITDSCFGRI
jgi:hypothetical protein